eukprot:TRINITY_DN9584_c0_g1_i1.p1 TRINITY_DN9584_c0_g1~~TRINITY_DN9584_c0_g1_i1.p1  ORF type:complete len:341 (+),score=55.10 TRINITY_DN9584_c0_g1_i1:218-1240(+)
MDTDLVVLGQEHVEQLLPMRRCIELMRKAFEALGKGKVELPLRTIHRLPPNGESAFAFMPTFLSLEESKYFGAKVLSIFPNNSATNFETHQGGVLLFDGINGRPLAFIDAFSITRIRTAAVSALATDLLANPSSPSNPLILGILGTGVQAESHVLAILCVRNIRAVLIWGRNKDRAARLANTVKKLGIDVEVMESADQVVSASDILCTLTGATEPIVRRKYLKSGVHINAVGAHTPTTRELDSETMKIATLFADKKESLFKEAGDFLIPKSEGVIDESNVAGEISDLVLGKLKGREFKDEVTVFKSLGLALEDLMCAYEIYTKAKSLKIGNWVPFGKCKL